MKKVDFIETAKDLIESAEEEVILIIGEKLCRNCKHLVPMLHPETARVCSYICLLTGDETEDPEYDLNWCNAFEHRDP